MPVKIGRHRPALPSITANPLELRLLRNLQPLFCRSVKQHYGKFAEATRAESQLTRGLRSHDIDDGRLPPATVASTIVTDM
jgi:hypothetical protein